MILPMVDRKSLNTALKVREGATLALFYKGKPVALLELEEKFRYKKQEIARQVLYGTSSLEHPGVKQIYGYLDDLALSGRIELLRRISNYSYELTPRETRRIFASCGWKTIAAFQTRNPPHRAHEYIQRCALEIVDGLLIHPVTGRLKDDDFPPEAIVKAYEKLVEGFYPPNRAVLATLSIAMRNAGPKEAVFLAIIRRNYGCTHFIVGRSIADPGGYYNPYEAHRILSSLDLGITPLPFCEAFFCRICGGIATSKTCRHPSHSRLAISMSTVRRLLAENKLPPPEMVRPEIAEILSEYYGSRRS